MEEVLICGFMRLFGSPFFDDCYIKRCLCKAAVHRAGVKGQDWLAEEKVGG